MREILSRILCLHKKKERNAQQFRPLRVLGQGGKTTPIRRTAVRETSLSRHNRGSIEDTLKPQNTIVQWYTGGLRGPSIVPSPMIMRRFASDRCCFSKLVLGCILLTPTLAEGHAVIFLVDIIFSHSYTVYNVVCWNIVDYVW